MIPVTRRNYKIFSFSVKTFFGNDSLFRTYCSSRGSVALLRSLWLIMSRRWRARPRTTQGELSLLCPSVAAGGPHSATLVLLCFVLTNSASSNTARPSADSCCWTRLQGQLLVLAR